jgi:hypothetical protein
MLLIYKYFDFQTYSRKLIKSSSWENKLLAIYHYQILEIKITYIDPMYMQRINSEIKCINCRNIPSNENLILSK